MTTRAPGNAYPRIRRAEQAKQFDRDTWAGQSLLVFAYDTVGSGVINTELLDFGLAFEGPPFFTYGAEAQPGVVLVADDYPKITVGVRQWHTSDIEVNDRAVLFYLGAYLWISIESNTAYRLRFRLSFEGTAFRNVEHFRG